MRRMNTGRPAMLASLRTVISSIAHHSRRLLVTLGATACVACAALLSCASSALGAEAGVGINAASATQIAAVKALGVHWVRMFISWRTVQPNPGPVPASNLDYYEGLLDQLPPGTKVILDVLGTPEWETGSSNEHAPPANPNDYATFVATLAQRWGSKVAGWEIWNEEDEPRFWLGAPEPARYVQLLQAAYPAIKAVDPGATVIMGGLTGNDYHFLEGVYAAGGKGYFNAVSVHTDTSCNILSPYTYLREEDGRLAPDSFLAYREVHNVMVANGDESPIWMTETSWRTAPTTTCFEGAWAGLKPEGITEEQQATFLKEDFHCLAQTPYVQVALWFGMQDEGPITSGLLRANGSHKPSYTAMREYIEHGDQLTEPCGEFSGPKIRVLSPANGARYSGPLLIHALATSAIGVYRIRLKIDGKLIRNYDGDTYPSTLSGAIEWQHAKHISYGWHTLTFVAIDKEKNETETSIMIDHVRNGGSASAARGRRHGHGHKRHKRSHPRKKRG
jgi:Cellulase (glycosyl hydrolase family 5)/Bacterial Ig domain